MDDAAPAFSSVLARVEVLRAAGRRSNLLLPLAREVVGRLNFVELTDTVLADAASLNPPELRSLDAVHLASARTLENELEVLVTYDQSMIGAARAAGISVASPA